MGTNCLGPYLFTKCLIPILSKTAASSSSGSVRVTWASSGAVNLAAPQNGVSFENGAPKVHGNPGTDYAQSKAGNILLSSEMAKRFKKNGIVSLVRQIASPNSLLKRSFKSTKLTPFASPSIREI